jgi:transposase
VYGSEAVLPTDLAFGAPRIQHYEKGIAEETRKVDVDSIEIHRVAMLMRHTRHEQQLRNYHDHNVRERFFNVGDLVLRRIQDTKGMHNLSAPWEGPFIMMEVVRPATYHLQWADGQGVPNIWNIEHLHRFYP